VQPKVLIVDDEPDFRMAMSRYLSRDGFSVSDAESLTAARRSLAADRYHGLLLDLHLPDGDGIDWIDEVRDRNPELALVVITGSSDVPTAVEAMRRGADHFVTKPIQPAEVAAYVRRFIGRSDVRPQQRRKSAAAPAFLGNSAAARHVRQMAELAAHSDAVVLITGETGCGKGVLARWIHEHGPHASRELVEVNCSALRGELLANEMFGHARGAFTSAADAQPGILDVCDGATLFLDEIGDMDIAIQAQLLKTIEEKRYRRLGETTTRSSDFRLICATNHSLEDDVAAGRFRKDLFYRINVLTIVVPPLREWKADIRPLALQLLGSFGAPPIDEAALELIERHHWPGNVRELRNALERAALLARQDGSIRPKHLASLDVPPPAASEDDAIAALTRNGGDKVRAARELGVSRATFYRRLRGVQTRVSGAGQ